MYFFFRSIIKNDSLRILIEVGLLLYFGFFIYVFFYFIIIVGLDNRDNVVIYWEIREY